MRGIILVWMAASFGGIVVAGLRAAEAEGGGRTSISIEQVYLNDREVFRAVVRRHRSVDGTDGKSVLIDLPRKADFSSVLVRASTADEGADILEHRIHLGEKDPDSILGRFLGKDVIVNRKLPPSAEKARAPVETIQATLISFDARVLVLKTNNPQLPLLMIPRSEEITEIKLRGEAEGVVAGPAVEVNLNGLAARELSYSYRVSDVQWRGQYRVIVDDAGDAKEVMGAVDIFNDSGEAYSNAEVTIGTRSGQRSIFESKLPRPVGLDAGWTRVGLFQLRGPRAEKVYLIDWNTREGGHDAIVIRNGKEAGLGIPLPQGKLEVLRQRDLMPLNEPILLAGAAVGKDLILPIAEARGIDRVRRVRPSALPEPDGVWRRRDEIELTLISTRAEATRVRVIDNIARRVFRIGSGSDAHEVQDEGRIGFVADVPAGGEKVIRYSVDHPDR